MTKWGGRPHWEYDTRYLGEDEHGDWIGSPPGTFLSRPGRAYDAEHAFVCLVPRPGAGGGAAWVATFNGDGDAIKIYVDMSSVPVWTHPDDADGGPDGVTRVTAVDLDLDVVRRADGEPVYVDDEDEFAEHQVAYGYPSEVVSLAEESAAWVFGEVVAGRAPFDDETPARWLRRLADLADLPRP